MSKLVLIQGGLHPNAAALDFNKKGELFYFTQGLHCQCIDTSDLAAVVQNWRCFFILLIEQKMLLLIEVLALTKCHNQIVSTSKKQIIVINNNCGFSLIITRYSWFQTKSLLHCWLLKLTYLMTLKLTLNLTLLLWRILDLSFLIFSDVTNEVQSCSSCLHNIIIKIGKVFSLN